MKRRPWITTVLTAGIGAPVLSIGAAMLKTSAPAGEDVYTASFPADIVLLADASEPLEIDLAAELYHLGLPRLLIPGANLDEVHEHALKAQARGVPPEAIEVGGIL